MPNSRALDEGIVVYNALNSTNTAYALSANMGRVLNENHEALVDRVEALESGSGGSGSDTTFTPATDADIDALFQ